MGVDECNAMQEWKVVRYSYSRHDVNQEDTHANVSSSYNTRGNQIT